MAGHQGADVSIGSRSEQPFSHALHVSSNHHSTRVVAVAVIMCSTSVPVLVRLIELRGMIAAGSCTSPWSDVQQ